MENRQVLQRILIVGFGLLMLLFLTGGMFLTIDAGERGILFRRFGGGLDMETIYTPGFHVVAPWNSMYVYDVREKQIEEEMEVLSSNGLNIRVDVTVRTNPVYHQIALLHETFGKDYMNTLVRPEVRSAVRKIIGRFEPEELYSSKRDEVQQLIQDDLMNELKKNYVELRATLIRDIALPEKIQNAIERKLQQEQESEEYKYRLQKETQEAERKIIEARAKAKANEIISASLTDKILRDKGIEATLELSKSPNSKVVVIGSGKEGLPLILGDSN
ncbi:MAG: prohibitin family protein [Lewinellaceae bacterium]|nr:prohibitin family protein [Saprospiraceae bacterium]MCB9312450.1 prohibitin family protein [Lewinellaceae bacterium]HRW76785.1 prohibitin family protein [Saprospiraceae bacterium]